MWLGQIPTFEGNAAQRKVRLLMMIGHSRGH